ncbi:MAG: cytidylyltransferase domain-containing protein [Tagaea sp.]
MRIVAIVQARLDSRRLPGKVLRPMAGRPMLAHVFEALRRARALDGAVLATSRRAVDDPIAAFARAEGIVCHRGPLDDVAARLLAAARAESADALVRISGDSPLMDPALVTRAAGELRADAALDLATNVFPRAYPKGMSVEAIRTAALARAVARMTRAEEREHVTPHFYANPAAFRIVGFAPERPRPDLQLSVDTAEDFARCEAILAALGDRVRTDGWEACAAAAASDDYRLAGANQRLQ